MARPERRRRRVWSVLAHAAVMAAIVTVAVRTGLDLADGASRTDVVIPIGALTFVALAVLAFVRFEAFLILVLAIRASLDIAKLGDRSSASLEPASALAGLFILAALIWLARRPVVPPVPRSPLRRPLIALFLAGLLSVVGAARPATSLVECGRIAAVLVMLVALEALLSHRRHRRHLIVAAFVSAVIPLAVAAYQASSGSGILEAGGFSRIRGTFVHPNPFAIYLALLLVMGAALVPHVHGKARFGLMAVLAGSSGCLFLTYTRTAWIAAVLGLLVVGALQSRALIVGLVVGAAVVLLAVPSVAGRFSDLGQERHLSGTPGNSLVWRFEYWGEALSLTDGNPVTGIGLKMTQFETEEAKAPHNDFIRVYVETGLVGLVAYLALLAGMLQTAKRAVRGARPGIDRGMAVGFAGCVATFILVSIVSNVISQVVILWYFVAFGAVAAAAARLGRDRDGGVAGGEHVPVAATPVWPAR